MKTQQKFLTISEIANRAISQDLNLHKDKMSLVMDIEYTNDIMPLRLDELLKADELNFTHDIIGIQVNFNRATKRMDNCFLPRYTK